MTEIDREEFARHLVALAETFGEPLSSARITGYFTALSDLPLETALEAIEAALRGSRFFPKPVELRELAGAGDPDVGVVESLIMGRLYGRATPCPDFVDLAIQRLGGLRACQDMPPAVRIGHLKSIVPGLLAAGRARGWELPTAATDAPMIVRRDSDALAIEDQRSKDALPPPDSPLGQFIRGGLLRSIK